MIIKLSKFERVAGLFVLICVVGALVTGVSAAIKQGWFEKKIFFTTTFESADGIHTGTQVLISGLRAGIVEEVELQKDNQVKVYFYVLGKFYEKVREDSVVQLIRPFIVGERVLDLSVGNQSLPLLAEHTQVKSTEAIDVMTLMSGKKMNTYFSKIGSMVENLQALAEAFLDKNRTKSMVSIFDKLDPLLTQVTLMTGEITKLSKQATKDQNLEHLLVSLNKTTVELNKILPDLNNANPQLAQNLASMIKDISEISKDAKVLGPAFQEIGPDMPMAARRMVEALNETVVMMKAMQKSILIRGSIEEVREEEAKNPRMPASTK